MAVPPSDKVPAAKLYRTQYLRQSVSNCTGYSIRSKKTTDGIIYYIHYLYFRAQNNGSWYSPLEFNFDHDVPFYLDASGSSGVTNLYVFVDGQQYTFNNASGYQVQCAMASYTTYTDATWPFTTSTIAPLYDPAYADTEVSPIIINKLTRSQYESVAPNETELYLVTDANLETTDHKVQTIDANSTDTQYPSATAVNNVKYQNEPFWIQPTENAYVGLIGMTMGPSATRNISYSFDGIEWIDTTVKGLIEGYRYVLQGEKIYFKSSSTGRYWSTQFVVKDSNSSSSNNVDFTVGGKLISLFNGIPGDATSLLSETNVTDASKLDINSETTCCTCASLFVDCVVLNTPPVLPATLLPDSAYNSMFYGCISLINAPALPAETLTDFCYMSMFANCTSLRYAPPIKAKTLAEACCQEMFLGCTSLETAPELLATTMVSNCYYGMFSGCTSLKQIPKLYATTLAEECYQEMFNGCTSLELQTASDGTHYNIVKIPEKPRYDWTLTWNNSMVTAPNGSAIFNDTLVTGVESPVFPTPLYALPSATTFNGSSTYIDTGVQLLNTDQDFTIFVDFQYNSQTSMMTVFHCINEASPYPGILLDAYNSYFRAVYYGAKNIAAYDTNRHKIIFTHSAGTTTSCLIYFDSTTGVTNTVDRAYSNVSQNVLLGCYQDTSGNKGRWFNGTIYDARIYNEVLSSTQIGYLMSSGNWSVRGATLTGLTFKRNNITYDSINVDLSGNMYYGSNGAYVEAYYASTGWVDASYKTLTISNDPADFEDKFINSGTPINLYDPTTITTGYYINSSGVKTTGAAASISDYIPVIPGHNYTWTGVAMESGTNNKRVAGYATASTTTGTVINNVAVTGTNVPYENTFTVPSGLNYVRLSFNTVDTDIVLVDNDAAGENAWGTFKDTNLTISYAWDARGLSLTGMNFKSNNTDFGSISVNDNGDTISYDSTIVYNSNGWTNSGYKTLTSAYNLVQHFTSTDWSGFFETNKNTNTSSTITVPSNALSNMFANTGGTWTGTPVINKAYFTNAVLIPEANKAQTNAGYPEIWWKDGPLRGLGNARTVHRRGH